MKNYFFMKISFVLSALLLMISCSEDKIVDSYVSDGVSSSYEKLQFGYVLNNQADTSNLMTLNVGNYWKFDVSYCIAGICNIPYYEMLQVVDVEDINGEI